MVLIQMKRQPLRFDILIIIAISSIVMSLCAAFDLVDRLFHFTRPLANYEVDELVPAIIVMLGGFSWLYYRQNQELKYRLVESTRMEREIARAKTYWEQTFDTIPDMIAVIDDTYRIVRINKTMSKQLGMTTEDAIGRKCYELLHGFDAPIPDCLFKRLLADGREHSAEIRYDQWGLDFLVTHTPVYGDDGHITGAVYIARNIMAQKKADRERMKLEARLWQKKKIESIGILAGGIAHDFNNILMSIYGNAEIITNFYVNTDSPIHAKIQSILTAAKRARVLIRQILKFSRDTDAEKQPILLAPIIEETLKLMRASLPSSIEIRPQIKKTKNIIVANSTRMHQVLMNLCTNAGHAMREEGGVLTVGLADVDLTSDFTEKHPGIEPGPYLELTVSDTGHGMSPDVIKRIYDPFYTLKDKYEGTGLGLSVVYGIITNHGGIITVQSEPGNGATFKIYLPAIQKEIIAERKHGVTIPVGKGRILFIDDELELATLGKEILNQLGYHVTISTSSHEAFDVFKDNPGQFDLVISDLTMPYLTGDKLAQKITGIRPDIPIILCTGLNHQIPQKTAEQAGIRGYLYKPFSIIDLASTLRKVLDATQ